MANSTKTNPSGLREIGKGRRGDAIHIYQHTQIVPADGL